MSWDYTRFKATCKTCGRTGVCVRGSDDWMRSSITWEGFDSKAPSAYEVTRKRVDARDSTGVCECGSSEIELGEIMLD